MVRQLACIASLPALLQVTCSWATHSDPLTDSATTPNSDYEVFWEGDNPCDRDVDSNGSCGVFSNADVPAGSDRDYFPAAAAQHVLNAYDNSNIFLIGNPNGHHHGFSALGFIADEGNAVTFSGFLVAQSCPDGDTVLPMTRKKAEAEADWERQ